MAIGRLSMKVGKAGKAGPHAAYIAREGQYESRLEKGERLEATESGNMPKWAKDQPQAFWLAADAFERSNGTTYREMEIALPRELDAAQQVELVREWVKQEIGDRHAYQWAIHVPMAADGGEQPHVHLMFSERQVDGIERDPQQYFKRYNAKAPEKGGARKGYGEHAGQTLSRAERTRDLKELRSRWADVCNGALERAGSAERIDMRSHAERGTGIEPERKQLPSEWRDPQQRAQVIEFRAARSELTTATRELARAVPDVRGELINLERERERRRLVDKTPSRLPANPLPPWARNPHRMATVDDISAHGERLFGPSKAPEHEVPAPVRMDEAPRAASSTESRPLDSSSAVPFEEPSLEEQLREQEPPTPVEPVREAPPAAEKLTGSAAIRALIPDYVPSDEPVLSFRERMAAVLDRISDQVQSPVAAVPAKTPPAAVPAVPEPVHQVQPAARQPSANEVELKALKAGLVPVETLVAADSKVIKAKEEFVRVEAEVAEARDFAVLIPKAVAKFRAEHPVLAARHDMGWKVNELQNAEEDLQAAHHTLRYAEGNVRRARESVGHEERAATDRVREANRPVMARIAELESVVAREQAADSPSAAPTPSQRRSTSVQRSDRDYRPHVDRDEPERGMD